MKFLRKFIFQSYPKFWFVPDCFFFFQIFRIYNTSLILLLFSTTLWINYNPLLISYYFTEGYQYIVYKYLIFSLCVEKQSMSIEESNISFLYKILATFFRCSSILSLLFLAFQKFFSYFLFKIRAFMNKIVLYIYRLIFTAKFNSNESNRILKYHIGKIANTNNEDSRRYRNVGVSHISQNSWIIRNSLSYTPTRTYYVRVYIYCLF